MLKAARFQALVDISSELEWFANIDNKSTRRAYENALQDFMRFTGIRAPAEFRIVVRSQVIAWRDDLVARGLSGMTIRHRLAALSSLFEHLCESNAGRREPRTARRSRCRIEFLACCHCGACCTGLENQRRRSARRRGNAGIVRRPLQGFIMKRFTLAGLFACGLSLAAPAIADECDAYVAHLKDCTSFVCTFKHPFTGKPMQEAVGGVAGGQCKTTEQMPNKGKTECSLSPARRVAVVEELRMMAAAKTVESEGKGDATGKMKTTVKAVGKPVHDALRDAMNAGECEISGD